MSDFESDFGDDVFDELFVTYGQARDDGELVLRCAFGCDDPIRASDKTLWRQHTVWLDEVGHGSCMQSKQPIALGHKRCGENVKRGISPDQQSLL